MFEIIQQNPIVSLVLMVVPIVAATWKVMDVLFVKPRDFRIAVLEKSVDEIRREIQKNERADQAKTQGSMPDVSNDTNTESLTNSISEKSLKNLLC